MDPMSNLLIIVTARGGSKRIPRKTLKRLAGVPLLDYTARAAEAAFPDVPVLLSTEDEEIAEHGLALGWQVPFRRPDHLATDAAPTVDAVLHALDWHADERGADPELVLLLQPTSPFRGWRSLLDAVETLNADRDVDAVVGMRKLHARGRDLYVRAPDGGAVSLAVPNRDAEILVPNGALYAIRTAELRAGRSFFPPKLRPLVMGAVASIDIDEADDWALAESVAGSALAGAEVMAGGA